jgi:hypothetical protein
MRLLLTLTGLLALLAVPAAVAQKKPPKNNGNAALTIDAKPNPIVFSSPVALTGKLSGGSAGNVGIKLQKDESRPYGDGYVDTGVSGTTKNNGTYAFSVKPGLNTQYRVVAAKTPAVDSPGRLVLVRPRVGLKTATAGSKVRFSGSVYPALDGRSVLIQRRSPSGRFVTVSKTTLQDAGTTRSSYAKSVTVSRDGVYRTKVPGDAKHVNGFSTTRTVSAP